MAFYGESPEKVNYQGVFNWDLNDSKLLGGYLEYLKKPWQARATHANAKLSSSNYPWSDLANQLIDSSPAAALKSLYGNPIDFYVLIPELRSSNTRIYFNSLGIVYDCGPMQIQTMIGEINYDTPAYEDSWAAYVLEMISPAGLLIHIKPVEYEQALTYPPSSNRACRFPAPGLPMLFIQRYAPTSSRLLCIAHSVHIGLGAEICSVPTANP